MSARSKARQRLAELAARPDQAVDLGLGALLIAAETYESLDIDAYLGRIDELAEAARRRLARTERAEHRAVALLDFLFNEKGFVGNRDDYYDRRNSFLNDVIDRRTGIPITLGVLHMEVGRRLALPIEGVGFPGHFLIKFVGATEIVLDPFFGEVLDDAGCAERLKSVLGKDAHLEPRHLRSSGKKEILVRMLGNLKQIHLRAKEFDAALSCSDRILLLTPGLRHELRDRGLLYEQLECYRAAQEDLQQFLALAPDDETADIVRERLIVIQRKVARLH